MCFDEFFWVFISILKENEFSLASVVEFERGTGIPWGFIGFVKEKRVNYVF